MFRPSLCWVLASSLFMGMSVARAADANKDAGNASQGAGLAIGGQAPDFTFKDIRYASHTLKDLEDQQQSSEREQVNPALAVLLPVNHGPAGHRHGDGRVRLGHREHP